MDAFRCGAWAASWLVLALVGSPVMAEPSWHAGLDLHGTDAAFASRRPIGLAAGLRRGDVDGAIVVDPMILVLGWEMLDVTLGRWIANDRALLLAGWRQTSGSVAHGRRYDEALLLGVDSAVGSATLRVSFGAELEVSLWRHGGHIPSDVIDLSANAELATRMAIVLHLRFEIGGFR